MTVIYISSTEPERLREMGISSMAPEVYGADISWEIKGAIHGLQRKEFPGDFIASVHDGRLGEQIAKMQQLAWGGVIIEGKPVWTVDGKLVKSRWNYTRETHRKLLASIQAKGLNVFTSDGVYDTISLVETLVEWSATEHTSLDRTRNGAEPDQWGRRTSKAWQSHFLQGLPRIGPIQAQAIIDTLGFPFSLDATEDDLVKVKGIGKTTAKAIMKVFND